MELAKKISPKGFSLLEVVITLGVVSISVFLLASSQMRMLKRAEQNLLETELSAQINNMFEMIRANRSVLTTYNMDCTLVEAGCSASTGAAAAASEDVLNWTKYLYQAGVTNATIDCDATTNNCSIDLTYQSNGVWGIDTNVANISKIANVLLAPVAP